MPGAPSRVRSLLVERPGAPNSFLLLLNVLTKGVGGPKNLFYHVYVYISTTMDEERKTRNRISLSSIWAEVTIG